MKEEKDSEKKRNTQNIRTKWNGTEREENKY